MQHFQEQSPERNTLFPAFLKLDGRHVTIIGGGKVALEKLNALLENSPNAIIKLVAEQVDQEVIRLAAQIDHFTIAQKPYDETDLVGADLLVVAVNNVKLCEQIRRDAHVHRLWVNVADKPALCDFYLGSIVQKGNLKIAISTNGKSPTMAKRLKEVLNDIIPEEIDELLNHLRSIRDRLKGDMAMKVKKLNAITKMIVEE